jgi:hypothetical protein
MPDLHQRTVKQLHDTARQHGQSWGATRMDGSDGSTALKSERGDEIG